MSPILANKADTRKAVLITGCVFPSLNCPSQELRVISVARRPASVIILRRLSMTTDIVFLLRPRSVGAIDSLNEQGIETLGLIVDDEESVRSCYTHVDMLLDGRGLDFLINHAGRSRLAIF